MPGQAWRDTGHKALCPVSQPAPAPPAQSEPAVTAGSQGQPASVKAGCCSARGREGWLLLSQGLQGGLGQSPRVRRWVGTRPAARGAGSSDRCEMRHQAAPGRAGTHARADCRTAEPPRPLYCSYKLERALLEEGQQKPGQQAPLLQ